MIVISRLRRDHGPALLAFEERNRAYFAASIPDRGDDYFARFGIRHDELLADQSAGLHHFHLVEDGDGAVLGRVNLLDVAEGSAELGYRIAEEAAGRGLATYAVRQVCALAASEYGLTSLRAATTLDNPASHAVLIRTGFEPTGEATFDGRPGRLYTLGLSAPSH
ncbi:GNAT family N-acetyltransferase [Streptomyces sp. NPDC079020]|uniref:GNAT family N-acetyltransferase n=1 Tax=Streptomyces sp. NPDC079020 TaxID=3365722 RepID=UPI0037CD318F